MEKSKEYAFALNYTPTEKAEDILKKVYDRWEVCQSVWDQQYDLLQGMTPAEYITESQKRYIGLLEDEEDEDDGKPAVEGRMFMPETRNKLNAILSYYTNQRMRVEFSARYKEQEVNKTASNVVSSLYDWSMDVTNGDEQQYYEALECAVKGTVVIFEGWKFQTRKVKYVTKHNVETGEVEYDEQTIVEKNEPYSYVVPLESVRVPNFYQPDPQQQRYIMVEEELSHDEFMGRYGRYPNAEYVPCANMMPIEDRDTQMYLYQRWNGLTKEDRVKVIHHWDKWEDQYDVVANGVLLTPEVNPFAFDHKQAPFIFQRFEILSPDFWMGLSFPMKLAPEQDALNSLYNLFLMRTYASSNVTIVTSQEDEIEQDKLGPFYRIQLEDVANMRELEFRPISGGEIAVMDKILESINKSSIDPNQQGIASAETATAIIAARESANRLMGTFLNFLAWMTYKKTKLRVANLLQFSSEESPELLAAGDIRKDKEGRLIQEFRVRNQQLLSGKTGTRIVRIVRQGPLKTKEGLEVEEEISEAPIEVVEVTPQRIRELDSLFHVVPNSSTPPTKTLEKAMTMEYIQNKVTTFPQFAPMEKLSSLLDETFDQNPEEMTITPQQPPMGQGGGMEQMMSALAGGAGGQQMPEAPSQEGPSISEQMMGAPENSLSRLTGIEAELQ